jgi:hypothetical protein
LNRRAEKLLVLTLVGSLLLFFLFCSCENKNLIDPLDFFDSADDYVSGDPDFWPECAHSCGTLAPPVQSRLAPPPGGDITVCTGPNPTSGPFCIEYVLREEADVALSVYSQKGEKIKTLVRARQTALTRSVNWDLTDDDGRGVVDGTYRVFFKAGEYVTHGDVIVRR